MERASLLLLLLLSSLVAAELHDNEISEQRRPSPETLNVPEQAQPCPSDLHAVLRDMSVKLAENRLMIQQLQTLNQEQELKLKELEEQNAKVDILKIQVQGHAVKLKEVDALKQQLEVGQVAFSASLMTSGSGFTGSYNTHTPLVFRHVISNTGNAYNPNTGFFTAPVKGAYHFEIYIGSHGDNHRSGAGLVKNGEHVVIAHERLPNGHSSAANGATLLLEPGDVVYVRLWVNNNIYDDENHYTSFSGHLLFPM